MLNERIIIFAGRMSILQEWERWSEREREIWGREVGPKKEGGRENKGERKTEKQGGRGRD